jgi:hypothetical protein
MPPVELCSKCGNPGEFRPGHRQCRACEKSAGRERNRCNADRSAAYRETHREHYRELNAEANRRKKAERHAAVDQIKSVPCADCGKSFPPYVMDFDHRDPSTKEYEINFLLNKTTCPWSRVLDEIAKCDVVCARCHRLRSWLPVEKPNAKRQLWNSLKAVPCADCAEVYHYSQMDFDHVRGVKIGEVSQMTSKAAILEEAAKCDVVCANCHRERTQVQKKGDLRLDPSDLDMVWKRRTPGTPQTLVADAKRRVHPKHRPWHDLVGTMQDNEVARLTGISPASVCMYRKKVGMPSYRKPQNNEVHYGA